MRRRNYVRPTMSRFFYDDFNSLFTADSKSLSSVNGTTPLVNIKETEQEFVVEMAAPGMKKEDFMIQVENDVLTIRSERKKKDGEAEGNYRKREFSYESFSRSFNLNTELVNDEAIKANYQDGILSISIAKKEEAKDKGARLIEVTE